MSIQQPDGANWRRRNMNVITLHIGDQSALYAPGIAGFRNYSFIGWE